MLCGIAAGGTSKSIAKELGISVRTVNTHREHVKLKLNVSSVAQLTRYVISHRIEEQQRA